MAQDVAEVAEEHVHRGNDERRPEREQELNDGDDRDEQQEGADPMREQQHDGAEGHQAERESDDRRRWWQPSGSTIFGNWICLISDSWPVTDVAASLRLLVNHFQGRMAARMNSG